MTSRQISAVFLLSIVLFTGSLWLKGVPVSTSWLAAVGLPSTVMTLIVGGFERWLWAWPIFSGWLVRRPDLRGTWVLTFTSNYKERHDAQPTVVTGEYVVKQTLSTIVLRMKSAQSTGEHIVAQIEQEPDGSFRLGGLYRNEAKIEDRARLGMHHGAYLLRVPDLRRPDAMEGEYWTDRGTAGRLDARRAD